MNNLRPFFAQLIRLTLIIGAILAGQQLLIRLPMVAALQRLPQIGISARDLITAGAYIAILVLLVGFARNIEAVVVSQSDGFPWQSLVAQGMVLAGVVFAYGALDGFATALLGRHTWTYSMTLLILATVPVVGIGRLLYGYFSQRLEQWEG